LLGSLEELARINRQKGVSYNPAEHTEPEHLILGANVLLRTVLALSEKSASP
jgi:hypothetical protein